MRRHEDRLRILMADDDRNDHLLFVMAADEAGIDADVELVDDGTGLLIHLAQIENIDELPDIIVLDLRMPGLDGHRTLEELQAHPLLWKIPVVVFTSSTRASDAVESYDRGARWVDTKPSDFSGVVRFAATVAQRAREHSWRDMDEAELAAEAEQLALLRRDIESAIEDELLRRVRELPEDRR